MLEALQSAVSAHTGTFTCEEIYKEENTKVVRFQHVGSPPNRALTVPDVPGLKEFYGTYEHLTMYLEEESGDAAYFLASPSQWSELEGYFRPWLDGIGEDETSDYLPAWINECIVIGEIPQSGNYLLVPKSGPDEGKIFEFEHDGFEFLELAISLPDFVLRSLDLDARRLTAMASHLRFVVPEEGRQWWIKELKDNRGNVIRTKA